MSAKPATLCKLEKGKVIDVQEGFVETFNWMVDFIANLKGEGPIEVKKTPSDQPVIRLKDSDDNKLTVVTENSYDLTTHKMTTKTKEVTVLEVGEEENENEVFQAVPLSGEVS